MAEPSRALPAALVRRQQLVRLSGEGWAQVLDAPWDAGARDCLQLWARRGLPLVVTRQPPSGPDILATGLPAPARYRRRRFALPVAARHVMFFDEFPAADAAGRLLPRTTRAAWHAVCAALATADCAPRVYGGYGWQALTKLAYVHADSDLDLLLPVGSPAQADAVVHVLSSTAGSVSSCARSQDPRSPIPPPGKWDGPRLDGELLFPDGGAVAWREWAAHREGRAPQVLVKRLHGVALETPGAGPA